MNTHEIINKTAHRLAKHQDWDFDEKYDFVNSKNPEAIIFAAQAEIAYEVITGNTPEYEVECASPCYPKIGDRLYYTYEPRGGEVLAIFTKENKAKDEAAECGCVFGSAIYYG